MAARLHLDGRGWALEGVTGGVVQFLNGHDSKVDLCGASGRLVREGVARPAFFNIRASSNSRNREQDDPRPEPPVTRGSGADPFASASRSGGLRFGWRASRRAPGSGGRSRRHSPRPARRERCGSGRGHVLVERVTCPAGDPSRRQATRRRGVRSARIGGKLGPVGYQILATPPTQAVPSFASYRSIFPWSQTR